MALGMADSCQCKRRHCVGEVSKCYLYSKMIGRKRVVTPHVADFLPFSSPFKTSFKKRPERKIPHSEAVNHLELLPQDILIRVLCGLNHNNLKQVMFVSKAIHDAALIAKQSYFDFSTPNPKLTIEGRRIKSVNELDNDEVPGAPMRASRSRLGRKDLANITVALFTGPDREP